ncbi:MAG: tRNA (adenosine(37)-N6)-dimethylallyltransferase MiaA [Lachnospiraceae bacterium]
MKKPLLILTGPTAVGKTALSLTLAHKIHGSIISADSMQIYKYMDIGTAKLKYEEMDTIPHYLIDELYPEEEFNVARFKSCADEAILDIYKNGRIPIIAGGTGYYIQSVLYNIDFSQGEQNNAYRSQLEKEAAVKGSEYLHDRLKKIDPRAAQQIHPNNTKRIIRALEYFHQTNTCLSAHNESERVKESPFDFLYFALTDDRDILYQNIDARVDQMMEQGLLQEVMFLKSMGYDRKLVSMQGIGYKEILAALEGEITMEEAVYRIKRDTRHFAKRQLTWFRREKQVIWIDKSKFEHNDDAIIDFILHTIKDKGLRI